MTYLVIKYDMRAPAFAEDKQTLYREAIEQCAWADQKGFGTVMLAEHHGSDDGYLSAPLVLAGAIAARTEQIRLRVQAMILPFHNPLRLAEDLATLDIISNGRAEITAAGGYVASEFEMFGCDLKQRGKDVEASIEVMRKAWTGQAFDYQGRSACVTPTPIQSTIPIALGGAAKPAARRAARMADAFIPAMPELMDVYNAECEKLGKTPAPAERCGPVFLHIAEDPDQAWAEIAPHALHETNAYGKWMADSMGSAAVYKAADDADALRASGAYQVVTPDECLEIADQLGRGGRLVLAPLMGGMSSKLGWKCLELFESKVLPHLDVEPAAPVGQHLTP